MNSVFIASNFVFDYERKLTDEKEPRNMTKAEQFDPSVGEYIDISTIPDCIH
jgi:hypothetical protein